MTPESAMPEFDITLREDIYQTYHPFVLAQLNRATPRVAGPRSITLDKERAAFMFDHQSSAGKSVLDIGANQGYMSIEAALRGARRVDAFESNAVDGAFLSQLSQRFVALQAVSAQTLNYEFEQDNNGRWDQVICLNVLHHVGRYFDGHVQDLSEAKTLMAEYLRRLLTPCGAVWLQLGFNWQGNTHQPMFMQGTKQEMTAFVRQMVGQHAKISTIGIYNPERQAYDEVTEGDWEHPLWQRIDGLGEFANRPLYLIESVA
jgi:SAM-dependent methyltransferase